MPLLFMPDVEGFFLWGRDVLPGSLASLVASALPRSAGLLTPEGAREVEGAALPLLSATAALATVAAADLERTSGSIAVWALASKLALDLVAHERVVPALVRREGRFEARWAVALSAASDASRVAALARSMPPSAHAVLVEDGARDRRVWAPDALLRAYLDAVADALVRASRGGPSREAPAKRSWDARWREALAGPERDFETSGFAERTLPADLERWSDPALGARDRLRACFRLELPEADRDPFVVRFLLQSPDDPSLLVDAAEVWGSRGRQLAKLGRAFRDPQETLLEALGRAARLVPPLARALEVAAPEKLELDPTEAWTFLGEGALALADAGFGVVVPGELTASGQRRLRLRMRVGSTSKTAGRVDGTAGLGDVLDVAWDAVIGDEPLTRRELDLLARLKAPLVRFRGAWVAVDPRELAAIRERIATGPRRIDAREALSAALAGEVVKGEITASVVPVGAFAERLEQLRAASTRALPAPASLRATLRPYQERGLHWLATMSSLGLGACLADDMGLGKTMQLLALLLRRREEAPDDERPSLLVAPTSVIGNWEREVGRFAPSLELTAHYGPSRANDVSVLAGGGSRLVLTTYGMLRRDAELLGAVPWSVAALDEAQNIKNAASATARAARGLRAGLRVALTGTPVENRLAELWSILEFANPGLLGPLESFKRRFATPIERYGDEHAAARLRASVGPFVLRRVKSDPSVIADLPSKNEMRVFCSLTREQVSLYKALVDEELRLIEESDGIQRRGRVLALLTATKQICNHPAQYLGEGGPLSERSGKLARVTEMLDEALAAGDKALVFTQFKEMGALLHEHLGAALGGGVAFLHGGTPKRARDEMVRSFQEDGSRGPRVFVLSVKAGGTGLNLTAANHVFHFDRWWNPAVEDQATDRAYRIGQKRSVQVHKLLCAGTVEEKIDAMLEHKRALASKVVGAGEQWITELGSSELRALFALSEGGVADDEETPRAPRARRGTRARAVRA